ARDPRVCRRLRPGNALVALLDAGPEMVDRADHVRLRPPPPQPVVLHLHERRRDVLGVWLAGGDAPQGARILDAREREPARVLARWKRVGDGPDGPLLPR